MKDVFNVMKFAHKILVVTTSTKMCHYHKVVSRGSFELTPLGHFAHRQGHEPVSKLLPLHLVESSANWKLERSSTRLRNLKSSVEVHNRADAIVALAAVFVSHTVIHNGSVVPVSFSYFELPQLLEWDRWQALLHHRCSGWWLGMTYEALAQELRQIEPVARNPIQQSAPPQQLSRWKCSYRVSYGFLHP